MAKLTDKFIIEQITAAENIILKMEDEERDAHEFSLDILVGKTIEEFRKISNPKQSPRRKGDLGMRYYELHFNVLINSDGTFLAIEPWGDLECRHYSLYYYDGKRTLYSGNLL
ncbi:hypothetical protein HYV50_03595 [Candidatus Pacearchaeota archaeon]|nr:hypothetical protein [Candidatus Pacearchaeota archaeon]